MIRVHVICEGQTEEMFVKEVISGALVPRQIYVFPSIVGKPGHRGGNVRVERLFTDVRNKLRQDRNAYCTTFFDLYGLAGDFPGLVTARQKIRSREKARHLQGSIMEYFRQHDLEDNELVRFLPYVQMHEFEGLLFSDAAGLARGLNQPAMQHRLEQIRHAFASPEDINDGSTTAPSKRIAALFSGYEKPLFGSLAAIEIGLDAIRRECPLFNEWISQIESLSSGEH